jgi:hypothetical protein
VENINDLIYAYALGCLDPEDNEKFIPLNHNEFDSRELGEYQNLVSLLPIILTIETPDPLLKDNVAKKLYSLTEQKKTVIAPIPELIKENNSPEFIITNSEEFIENYKPVEEKELVDTASEEKSDSQEITMIEDNTNVSSFEKEKEHHLDQRYQNENSNFTGYNRYPSRYSDPVKKEPKKLIWGIILLGLLSVGLLIAYLIVSNSTNELNNEVEQLRREIFQLNLQLKSTKEMQDIVQSPNVIAMNLKGTDLYKSAFGKLFIDSVKGLGYIQFGQISSIPETETFQLWAKLHGKVKSLGTFHVPDIGKYYSFNIQNLPYDENLNFFITEEPADGSISPGNKVYLQGSYTP